MLKIDRKHSLWIRWAHWLNFPILSLMVLSGIQIYWANDIYTPFVNSKIYSYLGLDHKLAAGMYLHFTLAWIFVLNGLAYAIYLCASGEWRELVPGRHSFRDALLVFLHDLGLRKQAPAQTKFNAAQKIAYSGVLFLGLVATASGFAIYKPVQLWWLTDLFFGYEGARLTHFVTMCLLCAFFVVHIAQVIRAGYNNFQSMITGYEVKIEAETVSPPVDRNH